MLNSLPRIIVCALKGGSGKTILSLGITAAWQEQGHTVAPFKKGPDFIDSSWLAFAAGRPCHNLDPFMMSEDQIIQSFLLNSIDADISLTEGNRGLFDGLDVEGSCSSAELARLIKTPVILVVDVTMTTRTMAALIMGCQRFDPDLKIGGVIINRVAGNRQASIIRNSIERYCGIPVLGSVPRLKEDIFPERHMGLVPHRERGHAAKGINAVKTIVKENLDLDAIWRIAFEVCSFETGLPLKKDAHTPCKDSPRIGFVRDDSFWFYYPENLEQLKRLGADLIEVNSMSDQKLPDLDALYVGGGFPETKAQALSENRSFRESLKQNIENGLPVYAECGGLIYMGESLIVNNDIYPMTGALPVKFVMGKKPRGHGYTILEVEKENTFFPAGTSIKGHEFHYSRPVISHPDKIRSVFRMRRGYGLDGERDGLCVNNMLATYTHLHAGGNEIWGKNLFLAALRFKKSKKKISQNRVDIVDMEM